jgi:O-antigen/teichoic acid export membrane protein
VLISKLCPLADLAHFSAAQRLVWPLLMVLASVAGTFYPIYASHWPRAQRQFEETCQRGLETVLLLAGLAVSAIIPGAVFLLGLLGRDLVAGVPALEMMAALCYVKAVTSTIGPILYVVGAQKQVLRFTVAALVAKSIVVASLAPHFGYVGAIAGALAVEILFSTVPAVYLVQITSGYRVRWGIPATITVITVAAALAPRLLLPAGGFAAAVLAVAIFIPLAFATRVVRASEMRQLLARKAA